MKNDFLAELLRKKMVTIGGVLTIILTLSLLSLLAVSPLKKTTTVPHETQDLSIVDGSAAASSTDTYATTTEERNIWNPEIPTNEYWDYGRLNDLKLYVNNTDRNVVYALDPQTGKIIWTIWGEDYGFSRYEIRMRHDHLFISAKKHDTDYSGLWVFDKNGRLAWNHAFLGYLDMPQMLFTPEGHVVLESRAGTDTCLKGCGVLCQDTKPPEAWCTTHELWAFELATGDVVWVNRTATLYGTYMRLDKEGNIVSSGGGWGTFFHTYTLNSKTGDVLSHAATLPSANERESRAQIIFDQNAQTVSFVRDSGARQPAIWKARPGSQIYKLISEQANLNVLRLYATDRTLLLVEKQKDDSQLTYAVDASNGSILWTTDLDSKNFRVVTLKDYANKLILEMQYLSKCREICNTCPKDSWICVHTKEPDACKTCRVDEEASPNYTPSQIWSVDRRNGTISWRWHYGNRWVRLQSINEEKGVAIINTDNGTNAVRRALDLEKVTDTEADPEDTSPSS